ncbi:folate-binding protein [Pseudohoeflea suaedae]|uniref:Folate-binding protein n=1 Tax=Pseudohoeflea suaedae TaxID=877384 RepID=A0A4R5PKX2_9HYPH|nr:folate-binding protein YgfZ [Pseudohoeflea suaedae]TDH35894.1 folate-binding protein [Pseudohoeflea suaedae]
MPTVHLTERRLIEIGGEEATDFLERLVTADVEGLGEGKALACALLTPQGKILFDFVISKAGGVFLVDIRADQVADFIRRLTLYRLRAKVTFDEKPGTGVYAIWNEDGRDGAIVDTRFPEQAGVARAYGELSADASLADWNLVRISHGVAESGSDYELSDAFPHDVLMDLNAGVDFSKGCFVGQEVVSRMKHRKTARRRVAIVTGDAPLPASGTSIEADGKPVGTLGTVEGNKALAIVRIDRIADALAEDLAMTADGVAVSVTLPEWSGLTFEAQSGGD